MIKKITSKDVKKSFNPHSEQLAMFKYVFRPMSFILTPFCYNMGLSPDNITNARLLMMPAFFCLFFLDNVFYPAIPCFFIFLMVLDCVDGDLARTQNAASFYGKFLDGLVDWMLILPLPLVAGISYFLIHNDGLILMLIGITVSTSSLFFHAMHARYSFIMVWKKSNSTDASDNPNSSRFDSKVKHLESLATSVLVNGTSFAPLLFLLPDGHRWYILTTIVCQLLPDLALAFCTIFKARANLRCHRISRSAAV
jgi:phosphatidylglycerophosphate synthase